MAGSCVALATDGWPKASSCGCGRLIGDMPMSTCSAAASSSSSVCSSRPLRDRVPGRPESSCSGEARAWKCAAIAWMLGDGPPGCGAAVGTCKWFRDWPDDPLTWAGDMAPTAGIVATAGCCAGGGIDGTSDPSDGTEPPARGSAGGAAQAGRSSREVRPGRTSRGSLRGVERSLCISETSRRGVWQRRSNMVTLSATQPRGGASSGEGSTLAARGRCPRLPVECAWPSRLGETAPRGALEAARGGSGGRCTQAPRADPEPELAGCCCCCCACCTMASDW
mmetsp:Transcript_69290/g.216329  ORF Transcript_69290/g.216329 Transcript_69290/m.216329 type:complete len:280 (-) Transcript_69290:103-942(-)